MAVVLSIGIASMLLSPASPSLAQQTGPDPWPGLPNESLFVCNIGLSNVGADGQVQLGSRPDQQIRSSLSPAETDTEVEVVCVGTDAEGDAGVVGRYPLGFHATHSNGITGRTRAHRAWSVTHVDAFQNGVASFMTPTERRSPWHMMPPIASQLDSVPEDLYTPGPAGYLHSFRYSGAVSYFEVPDPSGAACLSYADLGVSVFDNNVDLVADEVLACDTMTSVLSYSYNVSEQRERWYVYTGTVDGGPSQSAIPVHLNEVFINVGRGNVPVPDERPFHWPSTYEPLADAPAPSSEDSCTIVSYRIVDSTTGVELVQPSVPFALSQRELAPSPTFQGGVTYDIEVTVSTSGSDGGVVRANLSGTQDGISQREFFSTSSIQVLNFATNYAGTSPQSLTATCSPPNSVGSTSVLTFAAADAPLDPGDFGSTGLPDLSFDRAPIGDCWAGFGGLDFLNPSSYGSTFGCTMVWLFVPSDGVFVEALSQLTDFSQGKVPFSWGVDLFQALVASSGAFSGNTTCGLDVGITGGAADTALSNAWCSSGSTIGTMNFVRSLFVYGIWMGAARRIWAAAPFNDGKETV